MITELMITKYYALFQR